MESVMNFLADYYYVFFIVAGVLFLALVGFIIESKKKQKNEFKGEEIKEVSNMPEDITVVGNTVDMAGTVTMDEASKGLEETEDTIEINDIPVREEKQEEPIEFYSGPVDMPVVEEAPVMDNTTINDIAYEEEKAVDYNMNDFGNVVPEETQVNDNLYQEETNINNNIVEQEEPKSNDFNIFDDIQ